MSPAGTKEHNKCQQLYNNVRSVHERAMKSCDYISSGYEGPINVTYCTKMRTDGTK